MAKQGEGLWYKDPVVWVGIVSVFLALMILGLHSESKVEPKSQPAITTIAPQKWDGAAYYDQIQTGMTRAQVEQITQKGPQSCTTSQTPGVGTMEMCSYGNPLLEEVTLNITYLNGAVYSKTKVDL